MVDEPVWTWNIYKVSCALTTTMCHMCRSRTVFSSLLAQTDISTTKNNYEVTDALNWKTGFMFSACYNK